MLRVERIEDVGGSPLLIAVGYQKVGDDEDGAVWITRDDEGRGWERITGDGLPFVGGGSSATRRRRQDVERRRCIAVGYAESDDGNGLDAAFWLSDDGRTWTQGELAVAFGGPGDRTIPSERFGGVGRPAVYHRGGEGGSDGSWNAALWYSDDAEEWVKQQTGGTELGGTGLSGAAVLLRR